MRRSEWKTGPWQRPWSVSCTMGSLLIIPCKGHMQVQSTGPGTARLSVIVTTADGGGGGDTSTWMEVLVC